MTTAKSVLIDGEVERKVVKNKSRREKDFKIFVCLQNDVHNSHKKHQKISRDLMRTYAPAMNETNPEMSHDVHDIFLH